MTPTTSPRPWTSLVRDRAGLWVTLILGWSAFVAAWPIIGILPADGYIMPSVYCVLNLQQPLLGSMYLLSACFMLVALGLGPLQAVRMGDGAREEASGKGAVEDTTKDSPRLRAVSLGLLAQALLSQLMPLVITFSGFSGLGGSCDRQLSMVFFGLLAFAVHTNNLTSPLLYGIAWRRQVSARLLAGHPCGHPGHEGTAGACGVGLHTTPSTQDVVVVEEA